MSRFDAPTVISRYEACPDCMDGSCRACGPASSEHAAPGVRLVVRRVRFARCKACAGAGFVRGPLGDSPCISCGPTQHELAASGIVVETIDEHDAKRWVPSVHLEKNGDTACGHGWSGQQLTTDKTKVTCKRCLKWGAL